MIWLSREAIEGGTAIMKNSNLSELFSSAKGSAPSKARRDKKKYELPKEERARMLYARSFWVKLR